MSEFDNKFVIHKGKRYGADGEMHGCSEEKVMKKAVVCYAYLFLASGFLYGQESSAPAAGGSCVIVRTTDHSKNLSFKVMTQEEYRALCAEISAESRCWDRAMNAAEKEWKANPETAKKSFPRNAIVPKKASISQSFTSREKAEEKVAAFEKRELEQSDLDKKRAEEKEKNKTRGQKKPPSVIRAEQSKQQLEDQRNQQLKDALQLFEGKLAEYMAGQPAAGTAPVPGATPAKPVDKAQK